VIRSGFASKEQNQGSVGYKLGRAELLIGSEEPVTRWIRAVFPIAPLEVEEGILETAPGAGSLCGSLETVVR
jgi:hypothetical protein